MFARVVISAAAAAGCVGGRRGDYWFIGRLNATYLDPDGYPAVRPPWGTLSAVDLNTAEYAWQSPLGEYPALVEPGCGTRGPKTTAAHRTAGGLLFIGATSYDRKFRAFDKVTGALLWESTLPFAAALDA